MVDNTKSPWTKRITMAALFLAALYLLLLIPGSKPSPPRAAQQRPFVWDQDLYWSSLESRFGAARGEGCENLRDSILAKLAETVEQTARLRERDFAEEEPLFDQIERNIFSLGPLMAACPAYLDEYIETVAAMQSAVKEQSRHWDMNAIRVRERMYRLLYGSRAAVEEVMLQASPSDVPAHILCDEVPSATPSVEILGVRVHSGDILVSRGGAATSALIARGNDFPGNFSHVALLHVDSAGRASIIESHIELGVAVATVDEYLRDKKLRVMVLRLRANHPNIAADPMLPHRAASQSLLDAQRRHIPYDFKMNFRDSTEFFCSEVVSNAYGKFGITLWMGLSSISTVGVSSWLAAFGVEHFETQEPSDLQYDPQLLVVAEWRDPGVLFKDHVDNAVIDAMLEGAEQGEQLRYNWCLLPVVRVMKGYSMVLNMFGGVGPVPEGMSATAALRNEKFTGRHGVIVADVLAKAEGFRTANGYAPPYWELLKMARASKTGLEF